MDPALLQALRHAQRGEVLEVVLRLQPFMDPPPDLTTVARFGDVVTGRVPSDRAALTRKHPAVITMKAARPIRRERVRRGRAAHDPFTLAARAPRTVTGRGVLVASVDFGLDFCHPHLRRADGSTRLLALWDQSGNGTAPPYGYGTVHTRADIDRALATPDPYASLGYWPFLSDAGQGAHGTHVLDIAAGNGGVPGACAGVAPEAGLIFVQLASSGQRGRGDLGDSVRLLEALDFVFRRAGETPCVVNLSVGAMGGPHDGSSPLERAMDFLLLERPGRAICQSTGNYYSSCTHAAGRLRAGEARSLAWLVQAGDTTTNELEVWYSSRDRLRVTLWAPDGTLAAEADLDRSVPIELGGRHVGQLYHRAYDPANAQHHIDIFLEADGCWGEWRVELAAIDVEDGTFHAWIERDSAGRNQSTFAADDASSTHTTGTICNGHYPIVVGAYDGFDAARAPAHFSSSGPTSDSRAKPDILAPGVSILAARSAPRRWWLHAPTTIAQSGASMAAPHVTGAVALLFEQAGRKLSIQETRRLLLSATNPHLPGEELRSGAGYLDVDALLCAASTKGNRQMSTHEANRMETENTMQSWLEAISEDVEAGLMQREGVLGASIPEAASSATAEGLACRLFDALAWGRRSSDIDALRKRFVIVGAPGERLRMPIAPGDILLRRGEDRWAYSALIADARGHHATRLTERGFLAESLREGIYHPVIEAGPAKHGLSSSYARRVTDAQGRVPRRQLILRTAEGITENPALAAAAIGGGAAIGAALITTLGAPIWQRIVDTTLNHLSGGYRIQSVRAIHAWENTPPGQCTFTWEKRLHLIGMVPAGVVIGRWDGFANHAYFTIKLTYDGYSVRDARIEFDRAMSSSLVSSELTVNFDPVPLGAREDAVRTVSFNVSGNWDPIGPGECTLSGSIEVSGDGRIVNNMRSNDSNLLQVQRAIFPISFRRISGTNCRTAQDPPPDPTALPPGPPGPQPRVRGVPAPRRTSDGLEVFFARGRATLDERSQREITQWFVGLPSASQLQLREGRWAIQLQGYASPDGDAQRNLELSRERANSVARALRAVVGAHANIEISSRGEFSPRQGEPALARKVSISIPSLSRLT